MSALEIPDDPPAVTEVVLGHWGRSHNAQGRKPPTFRLIERRILVEQRCCSGCQEYRDIDDFVPSRARCRTCRSEQNRAQNAGQERRDRMRWRASRQHARKRGAAPEVTFAEWVALIEQHGRRCSMPGCERPYEHMDHIEALAHGGRHHVSNLRPLCADCHNAVTARTHRHRWGDTQ